MKPPALTAAVAWKLALVFVLAAALFAGFRAATRPLIFDEAEFRLVANGIARHGIPVAMSGEDAFLRGLATENRHLGLWHPPLYTYLVATAYALAGHASDAATRSVGALLNVALVLLVAWLARRALRSGGGTSEAARVAPWLAALLLAGNPFFVQGALFADIDTAALPLLTTAWCGVFWLADLRSPPTLRAWVGVIAVSVLSFWAKLTTPPLCFIALGAWFAASREWDALRRLVVVGVAATVLFALTWLLYAWAANVPADVFVRYTFINKTHVYGAHLNVTRMTLSTARLILWLTPALVVLSLASIPVAWRHRREQGLQLAAMAACLAAAIGGAYSLWIGAEVTKYVVPVVPLVVMATSIALAPEAATWSPRTLGAIAVAAIATAVWHGVVAGDLFLVPPTADRTLASRDFMQLLLDPRLRTWATVPLPVVLVPMLWRLVGQQRWHDALVRGAFAVILGGGMAQHLMSASTPYSPLTFRPQPDLAAAADTLSARCDGAYAVAQKEIIVRLSPARCMAIATDGGPGAILHEDSLAARIDTDPRIRWVLSARSYPLFAHDGPVSGVLARRFALAVEVGDYVLLERRVP
ncbi:MAG: hypothetical protein C0497_08195 [Gemmatimonas sp.]|nr:hypothetical protein [Gemmatimonas sp.]